MSAPDINGYEVVGSLGEGGMGVVYLARQLSLNRYVAIKILPAHLACDKSYVNRFRQEAQAAAKLKHPGIVQIYDAGEDKGGLLFCDGICQRRDCRAACAPKGRDRRRKRVVDR